MDFIPFVHVDVFFSTQIRATDEDSGINGKISYAITSGNTGNVFSIKSDGNLTVERNLDRESLQQYHLKINAIDSKYD